MAEPSSGTDLEILLDLRSQLARIVELLEKAHSHESRRVAPAATRSARTAARPVAEEYLRALAAGDAKTANRLSRVNTRWSPNAFLHPEVYEHAEHLTEPRLISADSAELDEPSGEVRYAVSYHLAGETVRDAIRVTNDGDDWWISDGLVSPLPRRDGFRSDPSRHYSLRGAPMGANSVRNSSASAYVGVYPVIPPNPFYRADGDACAVLLSRNHSFFGDSGFAVVPNDTYVSLVQRAVDDAFDDVSSAGTIEALREAGMRSSFGLSVPVDARVTSVAVLDPPVVSISDAEYQDFSVSLARVIVSATGRNFRDEVVTQDIVGTFRFSVKASITGDEPSITVTR